MSDEQYRTKTGKVLTSGELAEYAAEAERGYDVTELEQQREVADAIIYERAARALRRRYDFRAPGVLERIRFTVYTLEAEAQRLRGDCNSV
jgi:hypothetical protein